MENITKIDDEAFELIWEHTNDAIFIIGQDGAILQANPTFTDILGWKIEEIKGAAPPPFLINMTSEQHETFLNKLKRGENISYCVTKRKSKEGKVLDILATYRAINKGEALAVVMYKDFTEQMKIKRRLKESEDCYRKLVDFLPDAIIVQNNDHIVFVNREGVKLLGQDNPNKLIGKPIWKFIYSENKKSIEQRLTKMMEKNDGNKPIPIVEKILRFDYKMFFVEITAIPIVYNGETVMQIQFRDISDSKKYEVQLEHMAFHDPLTGLRNRRSFIDIMDQSIEYANMTEEQLAVMYIDLDKFKNVNDSLGHEIGDELLKQFANRLVNNVRENSVLCRIGGDEFLLLINNINNAQSVSHIAERLYETLQQPYQIKGHYIETTASIGISLFPQDGTSSKRLIKHADQALYIAKNTRNQFKFYS